MRTVKIELKGNWTLENSISTNGTERWYITGNQFGDSPIMYDDNTVSYWSPERLPKYVKIAVIRQLHKHYGIDKSITRNVLRQYGYIK